MFKQYKVCEYAYQTSSKYQPHGKAYKPFHADLFHRIIITSTETNSSLVIYQIVQFTALKY